MGFIVRVLLSCFLASTAVGAAQAQAWPERPIRLVVTQGPGSGSDVLGRLMAHHLGEVLGESVFVENRVGASGMIGHEYVARSPADGYTLIFTSTAPLLVAPLLNPAIKFRYTDLDAIAPVMRAQFVVLVANTPDAPETLQALIERLRAGTLTYSSAGTGTMTHLATEMFLEAANVKATHVPYKGSGASLADLVGGHVQFSSDSLTASLSLIKSGRLRALAVTGARRSASLPDVPTLEEAGFKGLQVAVIGGLFAPKGVPQDVARKIAAATAQVQRNPAVVERFDAVETELLTISNEEFTAALRKEAPAWERLVKQLDLKM